MKDQNVRSILCIASGVAMILFPFNLLRWLVMALGILILVYGISCVNQKAGNKSVEGITGIAVGIFLIIAPRFLLSVLPAILGILVLIYGINEIRAASQIKKYGGKRWSIDMGIAILITILGASLILNPLGLVAIAIKIVAVLIIVEGVSSLTRKTGV